MYTATKVLLLATMVGLLAGCDSDSSPKDVVAAAASALKKDKGDKFVSLLIGSARARYSDSASRGELKKWLEAQQGLTISDGVLTEEIEIHRHEFHSRFQVEVTNKSGPVLNVEVKCTKYYGSSHKTPTDDDVPSFASASTPSLRFDRVTANVSARREREIMPRSEWWTTCRINALTILSE
jgi:hypothetical protein